MNDLKWISALGTAFALHVPGRNSAAEGKRLMMTPINAMLLTYALTGVLSMLASTMLWRPLDLLLTSLCGTAQRARFWTVWSMVMMCVLPLLIASLRTMATDPVLAVKGAVSSALAGILLTLLGMGYAVWRRSPRAEQA